jgi:hypothetical protein
MKNEGFHKERLGEDRDNPREVAFAKRWEFENNGRPGNHLIDHMIPDATERDRQVAATVIQWLGSNCGMGFIYDTMEKEPKIKKYLSL